MLKRVVVALMPLTEQFELGVACEVFGFDRSDEGLPTYDFSLIAGVPQPIRTRVGYTIDVPHDLDSLDSADLIIIPAGGTEAAEDGTYVCGVGYNSSIEPLLAKLRAAVEQAGLAQNERAVAQAGDHGTPVDGRAKFGQ